MTALFIISGFAKGGGKNAYLSIVEAFKRKHCKIIIISFGPKSGANYLKFKKLTNDIFEFQLFEITKIFFFLKKIKFDFIFVDAFYPTLIFRFLQFFKLINKKVIYRYGAITYNKTIDFFYPILLSNQNIFVPAENLKSHLINKCIVKPKSINVIINHIPIKQNNNFKVYEKLNNSFLTVSRNVPRKRLERVIELSNKLTDYNFKVIGGGKLLNDFKNRTVNMLNIDFLGQINDPVPYYLKSKIYFLPSRGEGFSYSIFEALFYKCKVIVYDDLGGNNFYLKDNPNYLIINDLNKDYMTILDFISKPFVKYDIDFIPTQKEMGDNYYNKIIELLN